MRIQVAVAHYFKQGDGRHGSLGRDPAPRVAALRHQILQLHRLFGPGAGVLNHMQRRVDHVQDGPGELRIRICVNGDAHVLDDLKDLACGFEVVPCQPRDPRLLGFECHRVLQQQHEHFDFSCYMEDDILITDADFFLKLQSFSHAFGNNYLLMPNRIETSEDLAHLKRFYIDGNYNPAATEQWRLSSQVRLCLSHLGSSVLFEQPYNLHAGCFFLNREQAAIYFESPHWRTIDTSFHGPLESAATLGMLKTFQAMKPCLSNGRFLTVEHAGRNFMGLVPTLTSGHQHE
jgi:hypothetical protein